MTCINDITTNDVLTLRLQANSGEIPAETFTSVLDAYEDALDVIQGLIEDNREGDLERTIAGLRKETAALEGQVEVLQEALAKATKLLQRAK